MLPGNYTKAHGPPPPLCGSLSPPPPPPGRPARPSPRPHRPSPPGHPRPRWTSSRDHPNIWSGIIAMQWTEYCQNLSAAVFHAPRQMSRAIKARELAPEIFERCRPRQQGTNGTRCSNKRANSEDLATPLSISDRHDDRPTHLSLLSIPSPV